MIKVFRRAEPWSSMYCQNFTVLVASVLTTWYYVRLTITPHNVAESHQNARCQHGFVIRMDESALTTDGLGSLCLSLIHI